MRAKLYRLRGRTLAKGKTTSVDLELEFEGKRAFVIWDSINVRGFLLKARMEIDPRLLRADSGRGCDYVYCGELVLPKPEHN